MSQNKAEMAKKWLEDRANPAHSTIVGNLAIGGLQVVSAQTGRILCNFLLPKHLSDKDGNWRAGAIATLIDNVGNLAIASATGDIKISVAFDISYFSTAKINEEVEIEARTLAHVGKLTNVTVEIRKKGSREMVAVGKQWMASTSRDKEGNWHPGAIATLIDAVGTATVMSYMEQVQVSIDFEISYFSRAKANDEVEIDAKVYVNQGKITTMIAEIKKKENGEMLALGRQWMASVKVERSKL